MNGRGDLELPRSSRFGQRTAQVKNAKTNPLYPHRYCIFSIMRAGGSEISVDSHLSSWRDRARIGKCKNKPTREACDHRENDETKPTSSMNQRDLHFGFLELTRFRGQ
jgi:hypothetical protein